VGPQCPTESSIDAPRRESQHDAILQIFEGRPRSKWRNRTCGSARRDTAFMP